MSVKVKIISGVMIHGTPVFPNEKEATIVELEGKDAKTLIANKQAEPVDKSAKVTLEIKKPTAEADALDEIFGPEEDDEE